MPLVIPDTVENHMRMYARKQEFTILYENQEVVVEASTEDLMDDFKRSILAAIPHLTDVALHQMWFTEVDAVSWGGIGWNHQRTVGECGIVPSRPMVLNVDGWPDGVPAPDPKSTVGLY